MVINNKSSLHIDNLAAEQAQFFSDQTYNPHFEYSDPFPPEKFSQYGEVSGKLLTLAESILETVLQKFGDEESFVAQEGNLITREFTEKAINEYIDTSSDVKGKIQVNYSPYYIARTAVAYEEHKTILKVRLPIDYREKSFQAVLNHEIGTHIFRWLNDTDQPWKNSREKYGLQDHMDTEEGLAVLNALIDHPVPYLWGPALNYFATYHGQFLSFSQLSEKIERYVPNLERRWKICVRVKRGLSDTSLPGAYTKDQIYFRGVVALSRWLKENDYNVTPLYLGKISFQDVQKCQEISKDFQPILPRFISRSDYKSKIESVLRLNKIV